MISVENLSVNFGGVRALEGLTFALEEPGIVGLVGPQGSGKTTSIDAIAGTLRPSGGSVTVDGMRFDGLPAHERARRGIIRTFQAPRIFAEHTALENVLAGALVRSSETPASEILQALGLAGVADVDAANLTESERRRLEIGRAMAAAPRVLLLDEPFASLDDGEEAMLRTALASFVARQHALVLVAERDLATCAGLCRRAIVLHAGRKIADGAPQTLARDPEVLDAYLGVEWRQ
jgi:branched-chain amino acid transport system ATP-binding protein